MTLEEALKSILRYPEMIISIASVLDAGVKKGYEDENWLKPDGKTMSKKLNFDSKNHHAAKHFSGELIDESGLMHLEHEGTRCFMEVVRIKRGITHPDDVVKSSIALNGVAIRDDERLLSKTSSECREDSWACDLNKCRH